MVEEIKKRRGRIPNAVKEQMRKEQEENKDLDPGPPVEKVLSKRGRKPKEINFRKIDIKITSFEMVETIVLRLPIIYEKIISMKNNPSIYESILLEQPKTPLPYNQGTSKQFNNISDELARETGAPRKELKNEEKIYNIEDNSGNQVKVKVYGLYPIPSELTVKNLYKLKAVKTDTACWWCCHRFDTYPVSMPVRFDPNTEIFKVKGCFCSFNCVKSYSFSNKVRDGGLISLLYKFLNGTLKTISRAPPKEILKKFGGSIDINDYRSSFDLVKTYKLNTYPMVFIPAQIEEHEVNQMVKQSIDKININKTTKVLVNTERINKAVKRNTVVKNKKLVKNTGNTLGKIMGIVSTPKETYTEKKTFDYSEFE